jgi:hypothetical protein
MIFSYRVRKFWIPNSPNPIYRSGPWDSNIKLSMSENRRMKIKANIFEWLSLSLIDRHRESIPNTKLKMTKLEWNLCIWRIALDSWQKYQMSIIVRGHPSISLPPLSSPTLPLFICISPTPLYHLQGPHSKSDDFCIQSPMTFQKCKGNLTD